MNAVVSTVAAIASAASCGRAEVPDDRGVDEHVQRLGGQRAERRQREREDLAVVGRAAHREHASAGSTIGARVKLRLYHHPDGARVAYREAGTGPPLALLHSARLSHRELEPVVEELADRFRLVLPTCRCTATPRTGRATRTRREWLAEVMAGFCARRAARGRWSAATRSARSCCCARSSRAS